MSGTEVIVPIESTTRKRRESRIASLDRVSFLLDSGNEAKHSTLHTDKETYVPPWTEPYIIGIAGPSGSGKTSVASKIIQAINTPWTVLISLDNYYKPLTPEERKLAFQSKWDFDTPDAIDLDLCYQTVKALKEGQKASVPVYSFSEHARTDSVITVYGANVIIVEGIYVLHHEKLRSLMHMKVYVDTDLDICLARRLSRDTITRGRDLEGAIGQWESFVKPNAEKSVKPTMRNADLIVPRGSENTIAIDMLIKHIKKQLIKKSEMHLDKLDKLTGKLEISSQKFPNLKRLDRSDQLRGVYTVLLNKETSRADFIFYFDRIATNLINKALEFQTFEKTCLITPLNIRFEGVLPSDQIIAVSIIRSGDCFMHSLRKTIPEVPIGKLLIQSDSTTGEPRLHTEALPPCIDEANTKVLLLDAQIISGAAVIMATQVLVDHGVKPENIVLVTYLATEIGLGRLLKAFKGIKVVVGEIGFREDLIRQSWFRTRFIDAKYFGTA